MELPDEIFSEISGVAVTDPVYESQHERRAHPRVAFGGRARISPLFDTMSNRGMPVLLRDVSKAGVGFLCAQPLETSDEFIISLRSKSNKLIKIHCMVRRCDPGGIGLTQFDIGATFELVLETNAAPEETGVQTDVRASAGAADKFASVDSSLSRGGPIKRLLIRPVHRLASGICSLISTYRNNFRLRRRLKADARNKRPTEEPKGVVADSPPVPETVSEPAIASPPPAPLDRPFVPRTGGLFQITVSSDSPKPAASEPTPGVSSEPAAAPAAEVPAPATLPVLAAAVPAMEAPTIPATPLAETAPAEMTVIVNAVQSLPIKEVAQEIAQQTVQETPAASVENPSAAPAASVQLEFPWQSATVAEAPSITPELAPLPLPAPVAAPVPMRLPVEVPDTAPTPILAPVFSTSAAASDQSEIESDTMPAAEPAPLYRTHSEVIHLLKKRQSSLTRHPRRHRQT